MNSSKIYFMCSIAFNSDYSKAYVSMFDGSVIEVAKVIDLPFGSIDGINDFIYGLMGFRGIWNQIFNEKEHLEIYKASWNRAPYPPTFMTVDAVVIMPFHIGHYHIAEEALKISENIIFVIGSHDRPRDTRNPLTTAERMEIIKSTGLDGPNIHFAPQVDHTYNDERWIASIQASVNTIVFSKFRPGPTNICIIGYDKDHSSYYLRV